MRILFNIASALSLIVLVLLVVLWRRSYSRYEGIVHFGTGSPTACISNPETTKTMIEVDTHSTGVVSYRGQLTWASVANPLRSDPWQSFSVHVDAPPRDVTALMFEPTHLSKRGISWDSTLTKGFYADTNGVPWRLGYSYFTIPYWFLILAAAILPWRWSMNYMLRQRRLREGRCLACGHDLKGQGGKCSECGAENPLPASS